MGTQTSKSTFSTKNRNTRLFFKFLTTNLNACYKPPAPFVAQEPFVPYAIAAVQLEKEQMVVLGQVIEGVTVADLKVGMEMELVLEALHETDNDIKVTWKWQPLAQ